MLPNSMLAPPPLPCLLSEQVLPKKQRCFFWQPLRSSNGEKAMSSTLPLWPAAEKFSACLPVRECGVMMTGPPPPWDGMARRVALAAMEFESQAEFMMRRPV